MATNNRGTNRGGNRGRGGRNNNPEGHNQYSSSSVISAARENPLTTAAALGGAVAAGVFLWSRRNQISDQIGNLADQISEWREGMTSDSDFTAEEFRFERAVHRELQHRPPRPEESEAVFGRSADAEGDRQDRLTGPLRSRSGALLAGRPYFHAVRKSAIASPNSGLVTELI